MPVIDVKITERKPYAGGRSFSEAGAYEQIDGLLTFAVDPNHEANSTITDLKLAPRDSAGQVRFRADFSLLQPVKAPSSNGRLVIDLVNRGRKLFDRFNRATVQPGAMPGDDPGDGFLFKNGWSVGSIGWQWDVIRHGGLLGFDAPPVLDEGLPLTGQSMVTLRPNFPERTCLLANRTHEPYRPVRLDDPNARMYLRDHENGADTPIPREAWKFARENADGSVVPSREHVYMEAGFQPGKVYNLVYEADGARVGGAGLLAFRDFATFLRQDHAQHDIRASQWVYGFGVSQTGRVIRQYLYAGLNLNEAGTKAYDGLLVHVAGARRGEFNARFGQPSVSITPGFGGLFPFGDDEATDPFSGVSDGLLKRQRARGGVPKLIYTNTSAEYWRGDAALVHVDATGQRDLSPNRETRFYHFAGTQHQAGSLPQRDRDLNEGSRGRYGFNLVDYGPLLRAAQVNLDAWASQDVEPPASAHARLDNGTLVEAAKVFETIGKLPQVVTPDPEHVGALYELDLGKDVAQGIGVYPAKLGRRYPRLVPAVDADGNEIAGVRLPDISVPVATHTGWNPRHPDTGSPENIIQMMGFTRFFPATPEQREQANDPRPSVVERYASKDEYLQRVRQEALRLAEQHLILEQDVEIVVDNAAARYDLAVAAPALSGSRA
ncbi:MAG TPA: alpha/beta hydrolase domain-containing protein [Dehalococcoidia bacterium]|nr:alpha/beta hydrolase domain-containing protein [Dehalococcoidia bacterium]